MSGTLASLALDCAAELLPPAAADLRYRGVSTDTRTLRPGEVFIALRGPRFDGADFVAAAERAGAAAAVVTRDAATALRSSGCALPLLLVPDTHAALMHAAAAHRARFRGTVIAVAGSNGKTTVKEMIAAILRESAPTLATAGNLNNQIGVPLTLLRLDPQQRFAVVEIGANHPGEVATLARLVRPQVGIVTNAGAEHLEGFGSLEGAARAEGELFAVLDRTGTAIINADDPFASLWASLAAGCRVLRFGCAPQADVRAMQIVCGIEADGFVARFTLSAPAGTVAVELRLAGRHNVVNAAGAAAAALAAGATLEQVRTGLARMRAVAGRLQFKRARGGAWLIDDSY
ncbi:MAG: UDP-N-acetylmuramoyl-tripeptide--D-alanyl-D-alanine ligase, partial [Steroidobacteraceae bacterium]|nr:UDP-N-acetylmuramoyl-tripeptide--D-alanyl-D-alanine ligase [Steroidobacteraceae bacterium]MDW8259917.1 UDP-N-acetylmuramoyl-tripeptide--D-alanyl-D-alanine ligase [Gammaproteobacteria bacterium]